jgi:hypothetical protein
MINSWHNNRISKKLNEEYNKTFSLCDIDGMIRTHYYDKGCLKTRFIIYESKNEMEKKMGGSQLKSLSLLESSIDWSKFDCFSGLYILKILDIDKKIEWYKLNGKLIRTSNFIELYKIFSAEIK